MKPSLRITLGAVLWTAIFLQPATLLAQGTAFTYHGRLEAGGTPFAGQAEFRPTLWDAAGAGTLVAENTPAQVIVSVTDGLFVLPLDFGANFPGADRWLQLEVRTNLGSGAFTVLLPRQKLTPTPYAITAGHLSGPLSATQLTGTLPGTVLAGTYSGAVSLNNPANSFIGNGAGLTSLNADALTSGSVPPTALGNAWKISGNAGTSPGINFLGTTDGQPLELRVGNRRALRLEPGTEFAPNVIAGSALNAVAAGVRGATISGGGTTNASGSTNVITAIGDIGLGARAAGGGTVPGTGELGNYVYLEFNAEYPVRLVSARWNFNNSLVYVGSGPSLVPTTNHGVVSWSFSPTPGSQVFTATFTGFDPGDSLMLGLDLNRGTTGTPYGWDYEAGSLELTFSDGTVLTTSFRQLDTFNARASFVTESVAAFANRVSADYGTVSGGRGNAVGPLAVGAVVSGGYYNTVLTNSRYCSIGGGIRNQIGPDTWYSAIVGGQDNKIARDSVYASVAGGYGNSIGPSARFAAIGGGDGNNIDRASEYATIGAGQQNSIGASSTFATISGGGQNRIGTNSLSGAVGGGWGNTIADNSWDGTIIRWVAEPDRHQLLLQRHRWRQKQCRQRQRLLRGHSGRAV